MQRFFVTPEQVTPEYIAITGLDVNHIRNVLRMKTGEVLEVSDGNNHTYRCRVSDMQKEQIIVDIMEELHSDHELPSRIYLFQGLPKNDKMELIIQKAVELGAYQVIPVAAGRSVVKLDEKKAAKKIERWNGIAEGAAKQSGRNIIPKVTGVLSFRDALAYAGEEGIEVLLIPYECSEGMEETRTVLNGIRPGQAVGIFIGPEGGFEKTEVTYAASKGAYPVTLGKRILRTETAGLMILSILMYQLES